MSFSHMNTLWFNKNIRDDWMCDIMDLGQF